MVLTGAKFTVTGDTLCEHDGALLLERVAFPDPVITRTVEPKKSGDRDRLRAALERLVFEDPSFRVTEDQETGQWLIAGMGELHLEIKEHRLAEDFHVDVRVGQPRVAFREAVVAPGRAGATVDRVLGGGRIFGAVELELLAVGGAQEDAAAKAPARVDRLGARTARSPSPSARRSPMPWSSRRQVGPRFGFPLTGVRRSGHRRRDATRTSGLRDRLRPGRRPGPPAGPGGRRTSRSSSP